MPDDRKTAVITITIVIPTNTSEHEKQELTLLATQEGDELAELLCDTVFGPDAAEPYRVEVTFP